MLFHPCSQMKDHEQFPPLEIVRAEGPYLYTADRRRLIDPISSWWCKSLGHGHPRIRAAVAAQAERFEHVILAGTVNRTIAELTEHLAALLPGKRRVFYGGDGSTAVEIALKMAVHAMIIRGETKRTRFMALENGYHGETALTLAVSDLGIYKEPYRALAPDYPMLTGIPYCSGVDDPLFADCGAAWPTLEAQLEREKETLCALIVEPVVQGAGGMLIYSADLLRRLRVWTAQNGIYLIADEIMTGFYRTGTQLAVDHAGITPDLVCLSKGLTAGWAAMSAVVLSGELYDLFYADYGTGRDFLHSNTYAGNALAAAAALEAQKIYDDEKIAGRVAATAPVLRRLMQEVATETKLLTNVRGIGMIAAADIKPEFIKAPRTGYRVYRRAVELGALLRPLGNTIYWLPPLNISLETLEELKEITTRALNETLG
ncbi:MAG TPA: adenosylmethionine--8-amino-7-oxononanoate transaminase [bacterium]|nr:adenosylmethionine--8-amino-7-oxononanoate transaminase [bacterium]